MKIINCDISTKEKVREIRNAKVERDTTLWKFYVSSAITDNLLTAEIESTQITEGAIKWTIQIINQQCSIAAFFSYIQNINLMMNCRQKKYKIRKKDNLTFLSHA